MLSAGLCFASVVPAVLPSAVRADVEDGRQAANRGDFRRAFDEWRPLAERGVAEAQYNLGRLYANGDGVDRDYGTAFHWFEASAWQGHRRAQEALARMYQYGDGVPRDAKKSQLWKSGKALTVLQRENPPPRQPDADLQEKPREIPASVQITPEPTRPNPWTRELSQDAIATPTPLPTAAAAALPTAEPVSNPAAASPAAAAAGATEQPQPAHTQTPNPFDELLPASSAPPATLPPAAAPPGTPAPAEKSLFD